ncbi:MAG: four helix bundle protein [Bacteroidaceae bacterium]|nr:four helix bundle protein [Bacteroidaceae bacterium]
MDRLFNFQNLEVYQFSKELVKMVYQFLKRYPQEEKYALCDQLRRATMSIPSNIAEGMSHSSPKEKAYFLETAYGSLMEVVCQLEISSELGYITPEDYSNADTLIRRIAKMLSRLKEVTLNHKPSTINPQP